MRNWPPFHRRSDARSRAGRALAPAAARRKRPFLASKRSATPPPQTRGRVKFALDHKYPNDGTFRTIGSTPPIAVEPEQWQPPALRPRQPSPRFHSSKRNDCQSLLWACTLTVLPATAQLLQEHRPRAVADGRPPTKVTLPRRAFATWLSPHSIPMGYQC